MTIRISAAHRDALYDHILNRLSGINDVWTAVEAKDYERADRLGWEYSDALRLILEDLGWGDGPGRSIHLNAPPDVLRRIFAQLQAHAVEERALHGDEWAEAREPEEQNRLVSEASELVLAELNAGTG